MLAKLTAQGDEIVHGPVLTRKLDAALLKQRCVENGAGGGYVTGRGIELAIKVEALPHGRIQGVQVLLGGVVIQRQQGSIDGELRNFVKGDHHDVNRFAAAASQLDTC